MNEMSDPTMSASLAALLQEPGWERSKYGPVWVFFIDIVDGECCVRVYCEDGGWFVVMDTDGYAVMRPEQVRQAHELIVRIQAALAPEGTA